MIRRHPSRARLAAWLAGDEDDLRIDEHLLTCSRCATICEDLDEPAEAGAVSAALLQILAPPADLGERMVDRVNEQLQAREMADYVFDMFAAGLDTGRLLLMTPEDDDSLAPGPIVGSPDAADQTDPDPPPEEDRS